MCWSVCNWVRRTDYLPEEIVGDVWSCRHGCGGRYMCLLFLSRLRLCSAMVVCDRGRNSEQDLARLECLKFKASVLTDVFSIWALNQPYYGLRVEAEHQTIHVIARRIANATSSASDLPIFSLPCCVNKSAHVSAYQEGPLSLLRATISHSQPPYNSTNQTTSRCSRKDVPPHLQHLPLLHGARHR